MGRIYRALLAAFAVLFGLGLALGVSATASAGEDAKREDDVREVATVDLDDDGPDDTDPGATSIGSRTGDNTVNSHDQSGDSNDGTHSRKTAVSHDRDDSHGDQTKDWTHDGGDRTRDWSQNHTNDASRNDTR